MLVSSPECTFSDAILPFCSLLISFPLTPCSVQRQLEAEFDVAFLPFLCFCFPPVPMQSQHSNQHQLAAPGTSRYSSLRQQKVVSWRQMRPFEGIHVFIITSFCEIFKILSLQLSLPAKYASEQNSLIGCGCSCSHGRMECVLSFCAMKVSPGPTGDDFSWARGSAQEYK